jgi:hypothetical protein
MKKTKIKICCGDAYNDCNKPAVWIRSAQFAGDHTLCDQHARAEKDFGQDDSYTFWYKIGDQTMTEKPMITEKQGENQVDIEVDPETGRRTVLIDVGSMPDEQAAEVVAHIKKIING